MSFREVIWLLAESTVEGGRLRRFIFLEGGSFDFWDFFGIFLFVFLDFEDFWKIFGKRGGGPGPGEAEEVQGSRTFCKRFWILGKLLEIF